MKLLFLGSGSAFTTGADNYHSNMLLMSDRGDKLLLDCGSDIRFSLYDSGFSYQDITDIYISHLHADHVGGMEYIGLRCLFDPNCKKPNLYLSKDIASELWDRSLSGGMRHIGGDIANLDTYFNVCPINYQDTFVWQDINFKLIRVIHIHNGFSLMPSYGLFFEIDKVKIFLTTDTQLCLAENGKYYEQADIIFHDCETSEYPSPVHVSYAQLTQLPPEIKAKMWLYGYQPGHLPNAKADGFLGFVKRGQVFEFEKVNTAKTQVSSKR